MADIQEQERSRTHEMQERMESRIAELERRLEKQTRENYHLQHKLSQETNVQAHEALEETEFCMAEIKKQYKAQVEGLDWMFTENLEKLEKLRSRNAQLNRTNNRLAIQLKRKESELTTTLTEYLIQQYLLERDVEDLKTEIQVKEHQYEIDKEEAFYQQKLEYQIMEENYSQKLRNVRERFREQEHTWEIELSDMQQQLMALETELQVKDHQHENEIKEMENRHDEKMRQQYSYQSLSRLDKSQMIEIQKHLTELVNQYSVCSICVDQEKNTALNPCGHQFCQNCSERFEDYCPICKRRIQSKISLRSS